MSSRSPMPLLRALLAAVWLATLPLSPAAAQDASEGVSEGGDGTIHALSRGQRAPVDGLLIEENDLVRWRLRIELLERRLELDAELAADRASLQVEQERVRTRAMQNKLQLHDQLWQQRVSDLAEQLAQARDDASLAWYESPLTWYIGGVLSTVAVLVLATLL